MGYSLRLLEGNHSFWLLTEYRESESRVSARNELTGQLPSHSFGPALQVKYRYGNFYNCPLEEKGISVRVGAWASVLTCWRSSAGRASDL